jgi:predicted small lipoprotein YifL
MRRLTLALLTSCLLCACGQKGALYIPGEEREEVATTETAAAATTAEEREREAAARNNRPN